MENVTAKVKVANLRDLTKSVIVEALVDTGAMLVLPQYCGQPRVRKG